MQKKTMTVSPNRIGKAFTLRAAVVLFTAVCLSPAAAFSQEDQDEIISRQRPAYETATPDRNDGIWPNSNSNGGTRDNNDNSNNNSNSAASGQTRPGAAGTAARPTGSTTDGRDPGGNPDVPFDPNMNLAFLVAGVGFAYYIFSRKLKTAAVKNKA